MKNFKICLIAALGLTGLALAGNAANAMPVIGTNLVIAQSDQTDALVQDVNWVCGPYRCFHQRDYDAPRYYEHRSFYGHYDHDRDYGHGYGHGYGYGRGYGYGGYFGNNW